MNRPSFVSTLSILLLFSTAVAAPNDWPQWRGPNRDGVCMETGLLKEWPVNGPSLAWKTTGLGRGFSSVVIADGKLFTMGARGKDPMEQFVLALDLATRNELWAAKVGKLGGGEPRCTPTVDGNLVYAVGTHGDLVCLEAANGKERWRKNFATDFGGHMMSVWDYSESPLVDGEKLICTPGGKTADLVALNKKTGEVIWKSALPELGNKGNDGAGYASVVMSEAAGVRQYVQLLGRGVVGIEAKTGKFLWGYNKIANGTANIPTPIVHGDFVFCSNAYGTGSVLLKLSRDSDGVKAEEVYFLSANTCQNHHGGLVRVGDYVYGGHGHNNGFPICVELKTGKVVWGKDRGPGTGSAAVVYADGELYFRYENGVMALIDATPDGYRLKGSFTLASKDGPSWPHPVVHAGKLYIRDQDVLLCYDVKKPQERGDLRLHCLALIEAWSSSAERQKAIPNQ